MSEPTRPSGEPRFPYPATPHRDDPELFCLTHHFCVDRHRRIAQSGLTIVKEVGPETWVRLEPRKEETKP